MNIKSMLVRLESAMGRDNLVEQMILLPDPKIHLLREAKSVNLIVGYNSSPNSQTALDLTLWIAHQTRLATKAQVTVQVVYVVERHQSNQPQDIFSSDTVSKLSSEEIPLELAEASASRSVTPVLTQSSSQVIYSAPSPTNATHLKRTSIHPFEQADRMFWQARCLAEEWQDSFNAHLRFGNVATELRKVVELETAALLFLGCNSINHPIIQDLGSDFPCSVLGIPNDGDASTT